MTTDVSLQIYEQQLKEWKSNNVSIFEKVKETGYDRKRREEKWM